MKVLISLLSLSLLTLNVAIAQDAAVGDLFRWSVGGPLNPQQYDCTKFDEAGFGPAWGDNFICAKKGIGLQFRNGGPIAGMDCELLDNPAEDQRAMGGHDNFLCIPPRSEFRVVWFPSGVTPTELGKFSERTGVPERWLKGYSCLNIKEAGDTAFVPNQPGGGLQKRYVDLWHNTRLCFVPRGFSLLEIKLDEIRKEQATLNSLLRSDMRTLLNQFCKTYARDAGKCDEILPKAP